MFRVCRKKHGIACFKPGGLSVYPGLAFPTENQDYLFDPFMGMQGSDNGMRRTVHDGNRELFGAHCFFCDKPGDRKSTRLNSSHVRISYAVFCLKKKKKK